MILLLLSLNAQAGPAELRSQARAADCEAAVPLWHQLIREQGDDLEAWKSIAGCGAEGSGGIDQLIDGTTGVFEDSLVLGAVPALLDELHLRELVPILSQVETREDKGVADYILLTQLYRRLNEPAQALDALSEALTLDPDNVQLRLEYGYLMVDQGRMGEARAALRQASQMSAEGLSLSNLYAAAVGWPLVFLGGLLGVLGLSGRLFAVRRQGGPFAPRERRGLALLSAVVAAVLAVSFFTTANKVSFVLLGVWAICALAWLVLEPLRPLLTRVARRGFGVLAKLFTGRIHQVIGELGVGAQLALLLSGVFTVVVLVPMVPQADLRLGLMLLTGVLFFSTLGTIILGLLRSSRALRSSLRWLSIASTLPFLIFFLFAERDALRLALESGSWVSQGATERLAGYLLLWLVGSAMALVLAGIISRSILDPLKRIDDTVARVRGGEFGARTGVHRSDELGLLAGAVDEMAEGLGQRERIEQTFRQYVDPAVAERLIAEDVSMSVGRRLHATVLFSDVRGFTSLSERTEPEVVVAVLNESLEALAPVVARWGGVLDKFMGDAIMAVWGVPDAISEGPLVGVPTERLAVQAAVEMQEAMETVNRSLASRNLPELQLGVGVHSGELIAGPVGSADRKEYTVIGDTVNTAQRAESMARGENRLLITQAVADVVGPTTQLLAVEPVALKGKSEPVQLYRVTGLTERLIASAP